MSLGRKTHKSGNKTAVSGLLESIVAEHETGLLRYATRILNNNAHEARDVVQNAFLKLVKAWEPGTQPTERLRPWLYRVVHNEAADHIRRESRRRNLHKKHAEEQTICADGVHCGTVRDKRYYAAMEQIESLDEVSRQIVLLRLEEGLSYKEISEATGRSTGNVGCILHHAMKTIALNLKKKGIMKTPSSDAQPMSDGEPNDSGSSSTLSKNITTTAESTEDTEPKGKKQMKEFAEVKIGNTQFEKDTQG